MKHLINFLPKMKHIQQIAIYSILSIFFVLASLTPAISAQNNIYKQLQTPFYEPGSAALCTPSVDTAATEASETSAKLNLKELSQKYKLHSVSVKLLDGSVVASHNASNSPVAVASVLKIILADTVLSNDPKLDRVVNIKASQIYEGDKTLAVGKSTIGEIIKKTLEDSSNTGANVLIDEAGGLTQVTEAAHKLGYSNKTQINSYYTPDPVKPYNQSTVTDLTKAMDKIFTGASSSYKSAQEALKQSNVKWGLNSLANKWGGTSLVTGNSGVFDIDDKKYIITLYTEQPWENDAKAEKAAGPKAIKDATNEILGMLRGFTEPAASSETFGCACVETSSNSTLNGSGNIQMAFNYFVSKGFSPEQAAGILGNLQQESGVHPMRVQGSGMILSKTIRIDGKTGYGIAQWTSLGRQQNLAEFAATTNRPVYSLALQLDFIMEEMKSFPGLEQNLKSISGTSSISESAFMFHDIYENSADTLAMIQERVDSGKKIFAKYSGLPSSAADNNSAVDICDGVSANATGILNYSSKEELIDKIINSKNVVFGNYQDASVQRQDVRSCLTETTLVGFASMAELSGARVLVNALGTDHGGCNGGESLHNQGRAIDIGYYGNGSSLHNSDGDKLYKYLYDNSTQLKIEQLIWTRPPAGYKCIGGGKPVDCLAFYSPGTMAQHYHHIHVGFK